MFFIGLSVLCFFFFGRPSCGFRRSDDDRALICFKHWKCQREKGNKKGIFRIDDVKVRRDFHAERKNFGVP